MSANDTPPLGEGLVQEIRRRITSPGSFLPRPTRYDTGIDLEVYETIPQWGALAVAEHVAALVAQARADGARAERDRYERIHRRYWRLGKTGDGADDIFDDFLHGGDYPDEALS